MLTTLFVLIGITMSGNIEYISAFQRENQCEAAIQYIQSLNEKKANVFCMEVSLEDL